MAVTSWKYILKVLNKRDLRVCEWEVRHGMVMSFVKTQRCLWRWSQQPGKARPSQAVAKVQERRKAKCTQGRKTMECWGLCNRVESNRRGKKGHSNVERD